jgi:hypothetical protein
MSMNAADLPLDQIGPSLETITKAVDAGFVDKSFLPTPPPTDSGDDGTDGDGNGDGNDGSMDWTTSVTFFIRTTQAE